MARHVSYRWNGWKFESQPTNSDVGLPAIWGTMVAPWERASAARASQSRHAPGLRSVSTTWKVTGTPWRRDSSPIHANSASTSIMSLTTENTRWPAPAMPAASPMSSSPAAVVPAASSPWRSRCNRVRVLDTPTAPAAMPSRTSAAIWSISSAVAGSLARPGPITYARNAPWGMRAATSRRRPVRSTSSRYSPKLSQFHDIPSSRAVPGMSSTPSMRLMRKSRWSGRTGANPTPQFPVTTVVTPCQPDGDTSGSQVTCPS